MSTSIFAFHIMEEFNELFSSLSETSFPVEVIITTDPESVLETYCDSSVHTIERNPLTYCNASDFFPILCEPIDYVNNYKDSIYNLGLSNEVLEYLNILFTKTCDPTLITCKLQPQVPYGSDYYIIVTNCMRFELGESPDFLDLGEAEEIMRGIKTEYYVVIIQEGVGSEVDPDNLASII